MCIYVFCSFWMRLRCTLSSHNHVLYTTPNHLQLIRSLSVCSLGEDSYQANAVNSMGRQPPIDLGSAPLPLDPNGTGRTSTTA